MYSMSPSTRPILILPIASPLWLGLYTVYSTSTDYWLYLYRKQLVNVKTTTKSFLHSVALYILVPLHGTAGARCTRFDAATTNPVFIGTCQAIPDSNVDDDDSSDNAEREEYYYSMFMMRSNAVFNDWHRAISPHVEWTFVLTFYIFYFTSTLNCCSCCCCCCWIFFHRFIFESFLWLLPLPCYSRTLVWPEWSVFFFSVIELSLKFWRVLQIFN